MPLAKSMISALRPLKLRGVERTLGRFVRWEGEQDVPVSGGLKIHVDLANGQQRQMFIGCFARDVQEWLRAALRPGDTFIDVGANVGYLSLVGASIVGPNGRVVSIEPNPPTFRNLSDNIARNNLSMVAAHQIALSDETSTLTLYVPPAEAKRDFNVSRVPNEEGQRVDVPALRLDDCLAEWGIDRVRLMKVDVEGGEPQVFAGGQAALRAGRIEHVICEINGPYLTRVGQSPARLVEQLYDYGFEHAVVRRGRVTRSPLSALAPEANFDAVFVHRDVRD